jgi:uncharacterized membrane protein YhaH (DUF805 family)
MLGQLFSTKGRIGRKTFAIAFFLLLSIRVIPVLAVNIMHFNFHIVFSKEFSDVFGWMMIILSILCLIVLYVHVVKRLRDLDKPDGLAILLIFPLANLGLLVYLLVKPGVKGSNAFGRQIA